LFFEKLNISGSYVGVTLQVSVTYKQKTSYCRIREFHIIAPIAYGLFSSLPEALAIVAAT
jgi:hypothetical protein